MMGATQTVVLPDEAATTAFGITLASQLIPGDLITLSGELGSGKTSLARAIVRALMHDDIMDVPSPSFALVQPYAKGTQTILHADLYRLTGARDIEELGLFDDPEAIVMVEWPERAPEIFNNAQIRIELAIPPGGEGRVLVIRADNDRKLGQ